MQNKEKDVQVLTKQLDNLRMQVADKEKSVENSKCAWVPGALSAFIVDTHLTRCTNILCHSHLYLMQMQSRQNCVSHGMKWNMKKKLGLTFQDGK